MTLAYTVGVILKDPDETRQLIMDWTSHLASPADTIATSTWSVPTGVTQVTHGVVTGNKKTSITVSGGTADTDYILSNTITTTTSGETLQRSGTLRVRSL